MKGCPNRLISYSRASNTYHLVFLAFLLPSSDDDSPGGLDVTFRKDDDVRDDENDHDRDRGVGDARGFHQGVYFFFVNLTR